MTGKSANLSKNMSQDSDLSDSSGEENTFGSTQAPAMTQRPAESVSSGSDFSTDSQQAPPSRRIKLTGKPPLMGISPILAKLSSKDTSTPLKGVPAKPAPTKVTRPTGSSDSESDESEAAAPATPVGRLISRVPNTLNTQQHESEESDSEYDTPWAAASRVPALPKTNGPQVSDSDSDLDSDEEEMKKPVLVQAKQQSPIKANGPQASESESDSDTVIDEVETPPVPVGPKPQSPAKTNGPRKSDSESDLESEEEEEKSPVPVRAKPHSPVKTNGPKASDSDSELDSDEEEAEKTPAPVHAKPKSPRKANVQQKSESDSELDSNVDEVKKSPVSVRAKPQSPKKAASVPKASDSDSDLDSEDAEVEKLPSPVVRPKTLSPKKVIVPAAPYSDTDSDSDDEGAGKSQLHRKPHSPVKAPPVATPMEVDASSDEDDAAMIREAMNRVNQAEDRAKAGVVLRQSGLLQGDSSDSDLEPKPVKGKRTPKGSPRVPAAKPVKESGSFLSKATISDSDDIVSSDSEPEKLGPIRRDLSMTQRNVSMNRSITTSQAKEQEPAESSEDSEEEADVGPVVDNSPGLMYLEDVASDDEVWLVRCPADAQRDDLIGRKLVLGGVSQFTVGGAEFESRTYKHQDNAQSRLTCLLRSKNVDGLLKVVSVPTAGQVTFTRRVKLPSVSLPAMTCLEGKTTALPVGLKTRHPLFGADFERAITVRDKAEDRPQAKVSSKSAKKDAKRLSVTFREEPSFEPTQPSTQEQEPSSEEEKEAALKKAKTVESSSESDWSDTGAASDDQVTKMLNRALQGKQPSPRKQALKQSETPPKTKKPSKSTAKASIDREDKSDMEVSSSKKKKSPKADKSLSASLLENYLNKNATINASKNVSGTLSESLTKRKSRKSVPISDQEALSSVLDDSDSSVLKTKSKKPKDVSISESPSSEALKIASVFNDSDSSVSKRKSSHKKESKKKDVSISESPSSEALKIASVFNDSDSSVSKRKSSHKKESKKKDVSISESPSSEALKIACVFNDSDSSVSKRKSSNKKELKKKDVSISESPSSEALKVASVFNDSDSSVSKRKSSHKKESKAKEDLTLQSPSKAKKSASAANVRDSLEMKTDLAQVAIERDDSQSEDTTKKDGRKSDISYGSSVLADFLNRSRGSAVSKTPEVASGQDSHAEKSPGLKVPAVDGTPVSKSKASKKKEELLSDSILSKSRRKSLKAETSLSSNSLDASANESPISALKISNVKTSKMSNAAVNSTPELKKKVAKKGKLSSSSLPNVSANDSSLALKPTTPKATTPKAKAEEKSKKKSQKTAGESVTETTDNSALEDVAAMLLRQAIAETSLSQDGSFSKGKARKSSEANGNKVRVMLKAKRQGEQTNAKDALVKRLSSKAAAEIKETTEENADQDAKQQEIIAELMRGIQTQTAGGKKRRRASGGEEDGKPMKKSKKARLVDGGPDTPTSSKSSSKAKAPVKKYRQLTLTSTIPPGIAELSPASKSKSRSKAALNSSLKASELVSPVPGKEPTETTTPPSKEKRKRKRDSSVSDLETGSKKRKPVVQSEMGSQDASFTSKFQSEGYAGPGSPLLMHPSPSLGASQSDIDVQFESQDSIPMAASLDTNQFKFPAKKVRTKSKKLDVTIDFEDFGSGGTLVSSTQKQSPSLLPGSRSSQESDISLGGKERSRKAVPSDSQQESPFVFKAPMLAKAGRSKSANRADESGFESDGSSSRKRGEVDGFESDVTLKLFRTQADPTAMAKQRTKKHRKSVC